MTAFELSVCFLNLFTARRPLYLFFFFFFPLFFCLSLLFPLNFSIQVKLQLDGIEKRTADKVLNLDERVVSKMDSVSDAVLKIR